MGEVKVPGGRIVGRLDKPKKKPGRPPKSEHCETEKERDSDD